MKLWLLCKKQNLVDNPKINPWHNGWDMAHGFVIRAESEQAARDLMRGNDLDIFTGSGNLFGFVQIDNDIIFAGGNSRTNFRRTGIVSDNCVIIGSPVLDIGVYEIVPDA